MKPIRFAMLVCVFFALSLGGAARTPHAASPTPTPPPPPRLQAEAIEGVPFLPQPLAEEAELAMPPAPPEAAVAAPNDARAWSRIVFQSYRDRNWEIYIADGYGQNQTRLTWEPASDVHPRLNRGCTQIVFASARTGNYELFKMNADGSGVTQLTWTPAHEYNPAWSPDGTRIAFQSYRDGQAEVYVMNADGSGVARLTWDAGYDGEPTWSPDGTRIAFVSSRAGQYHIWVMNADGGGATRLSTQNYSENPNWSPDGTRIAYDADYDNDGWQELMLMDADGSNTGLLWDPGSYYYQTDAWAGGWSPDGRYVAFTQISFRSYGGQWYWTYAYIYAWWIDWGGYSDLRSQGTDWNPDWQSSDPWPPNTAVSALPAQSPWTFTVTWGGVDVGPSGLESYDVQVRDGSGAWSDWQLNTPRTSAQYQGVGGHTYYFRARARDNAENVEPWPPDYDAATTVESLPPVTQMNPLPPYSRNGVELSWSGVDPGGSGIRGYDVQYREGQTGAWMDWRSGTQSTAADFSGDPGRTYYFRVRAVDFAQNVGAWSEDDEDASTLLYSWKIAGVVRNHVGAPLADAAIHTNPDAFISAPTDADGGYTAYVADPVDGYSAYWEKDGYGELPLTMFGAAQDSYVDAVLPPADNIVPDWGFEGGADWLSAGIIGPTAAREARHTGEYGALLGDARQFAPTFDLTSLTRVYCDDLTTCASQIAGDDLGNLHVIWLGEVGSGYPGVYYARRNSSGVWSAAYRVSNLQDQAYSPVMKVEGTGVVHVAWGGGNAVYYARRESSGNWASPVDVSQGFYNASYPKLAVDRDGGVHMIWDRSYYWYQSATYYTRRDSDGNWSMPEAVIEGYGLVPGANIVVGPSNDVHIVWPGNGGVHHSWRGSDGSWSIEEISAGMGDNSLARAAVGDDGVLHVIWSHAAGVWPGGIYYAWRSPAGVWSSPVRIARGSEASLAVGADGSVHVACDGVYYVRRDHNGVWSTPQRISGNTTGSRPQIAVDGDGHAHATWEDWDLNLYYARQTDTGVWGHPYYVSDNAATSGNGLMTRDKLAHLVCAHGVELYYAAPPVATETGDSFLYQAVTIPVTMSTPILSFLYQMDNTRPTEKSWFYVRVNDDLAETIIFSTTALAPDWTHRWFDLTPWVGQSVILSFNVHQTAGSPSAWVYLDEVTIGSASPDLWIAKHCPTALPGEQVVCTVAYGNRGYAPASGVRITDTLPAGLILEGAAPPPTPGTLVFPWRWDVGNLPGGSGPFRIVITATVPPTIPLRSVFTNTVEIGGLTAEPERDNNTSRAVIFIGRRVYMPLLMRGTSG